MRLRALLFACTCALTCASAAALPGCVATPTLPLPPPVAVVSAPSLQGLVVVEGEANDEAFVHIFNERNRSGVFIQADRVGRFRAELHDAEVGDTLVIWQEQDGFTGERTQQTVPAPRP